MQETVFTLGPNVMEWLVNPFASILGVKLNGLVVLFLGFIVIHFIKRRKHISNLRQANKSLKSFVVELKAIPTDSNLRTQLNDLFTLKDDQGSEEKATVHRCLHHAWIEFSEGTQQYTDDGNQLYNAYQAEEFFTHQLVVQPFVEPVAHVGGLWTSVGLLCTFIALGAGMAGLIYHAQTAQIDGLAPFIGALSGKFITSILGLGAALLYESMVIRRNDHEMDESLASIVYELNRRVKRLTSQRLLADLKGSIAQLPGQIETFLIKTNDQDGLMRSLKDTIETVLKESVEEMLSKQVNNIRDDLEQIKTNLSGFGDDGAEKLTEVMKSLGPELREAITSGVSGDVGQLTATLERLPEIMSQSNQTMETLQQQMAQSQAEMLNSVRDVLTSITQAAKGSTDEMLEQLAERSRVFQAQMMTYQQEQQQRSEESMNTLTRMMEALKDTQQQQNANLDENTLKTLEQFKSLSGEMQDKTQVALSALSTNHNALMEQVARALERTTNLTEAQQAVIVNNAAQLQEFKKLQENIAQDKATLTTLSQQVADIQQRIAQSNQETSKVLSGHSATIEQCVTTLQQTRDTLDTEYQRLFRLSQQIASAYSGAGESMTEAIQKMGQVSNRYFEQLSEETGEFTSTLRDSIHELSEVVDEFSSKVSLQATRV